MEWPFIAGLAVIFILGLIVIGLAKSRWEHRKVIRAARRAAEVEAVQEEVLETSRTKRKPATTA